MHIPDYMIQGAVCPVTAAVSAACVAATAVVAVKSRNKPSAMRFGAVSAFIFVVQMLNFPVQSGTSGHLIGAVLACAILGVPFGILSMSLVVAVQTLVFSDGGLTVLGANILNMALIGSIAGYLIHKLVIEKTGRKNIFDYASLGIAAWLSVVMASLTCSIEFAVSGTVRFLEAAPAMMGIHSLIGIGEGLITVAAYLLFTMKPVEKSKWMPAGLPLTAAFLAGFALSPFASRYPDGLNWAAQKFGLLTESAQVFMGPLADYSVPMVANQALSTGMAASIGITIMLAATILIGNMLRMLRTL